MTDPLASVDEVAKHLNVANASVYRWFERRRLPAQKFGRLRKFKLTEVDDWVRAQDDGVDDADERPASILKRRGRT